MESQSHISFIIRTYNEAAFIGRLLTVLDFQENVSTGREVIVVDSGSTDDTVQIARQWPVKVVTMRKEDFDYSKALNLGIESSSGNLVVILSAHVLPTSNDWLARMLSHFAQSDVAGVCCRETPWPDADWREIRRLSSTFGSRTAIHNKHTTDVPLVFSNAASCIRRSVWQSHPFVTLPYAEDYEWASWAIAHDYTIVYDATASVFHSHNENPRQGARRLVNIEKASDLRLSRSRNAILTLKQAAGLARRDLRDILRLKTGELSRLKLACDCFVRAFWFIREFNR